MSDLHSPYRRPNPSTETGKITVEREIGENIEQLVQKFELRRSFVHKMCRRCVRGMYQFCRVHLVDLEPGEWKKSRRQSSRTEGHPRWSSLYLLVYLASLTHILLNLYNQYILDISKWQLKSMGADRRTSFDAGTCARLNSTIEEKLAVLKLIGAPNVHLSFVIECIFSILVITTLISYLLPQVYFRHRMSFNNYFMRQLLDYRHELLVCSGRIKIQVNEFLESSRNYSRKLWLGGAGRTISKIRAEVSRASYIERRLVQMEANNELVPFNRQPEWVGKWEQGLLGVYTVSIPYGITFNAFIIYGLYFSTGMAKQEPYSLSDWLLVVSTVMMLPAINLGTIFYGTYLSPTLDLIFVAKKLRRLIDKLTISHGRRLLEMITTSAPIEQHENNQLNCDILYLLVHYKMLIRDIKTLRGQLGVGYLALMILLFPSPVLGIIHAPYMDAEVKRKFQVYIKYVGPSILAPLALSHYPSCYLYAKCLNLHKSFEILLNQVIYIQSQPKDFGRFYDKHLVSLLRREASDSARIKDRIAINLAGIPSVYSTGMKVHYYFSLFIFVIMINISRHTDNDIRLTGGPLRGLF